MLNRNRLGSFVLAFAVVLLGASCAQHPKTITLPADLSMPDSELAILRIAPDDGGLLNLESRFSGLIDYVKSTDMTLMRGYDLTDCIEMKVAPSVYEVHFTTGNGRAHPRVKLDVKAGHTYYFKTVKVMDGKAVRIDYRTEATVINADGKAAYPGDRP